MSLVWLLVSYFSAGRYEWSNHQRVHGKLAQRRHVPEHQPCSRQLWNWDSDQILPRKILLQRLRFGNRRWTSAKWNVKTHICTLYMKKAKRTFFSFSSFAWKIYMRCRAGGTLNGLSANPDLEGSVLEFSYFLNNLSGKKLCYIQKKSSQNWPK